MKTFENQFRVLVEFRAIGDSAVSARLTPSIAFGRGDASALAERVLSFLLPDCFCRHLLYDGSYVIVSDDPLVAASPGRCADSVDCDHVPFCLNVELSDGFEHLVSFSLHQSSNERQDYCVLNSRFVDLRGVIKVDIEDDEAGEC